MSQSRNHLVEIATVENVEELVELIKNIPEIYGMDKIAPYDYETTKYSFLESIQDNLCFLSKDSEGQIVSVMKISIRCNWWSKNPFFCNDILYAKEGKFRYQLLKEYVEIIKYISNKNNIPFIFDMINYNVKGNDDIQKKEELFLKLFKGSKKVGSSIQVN